MAETKSDNIAIKGMAPLLQVFDMPTTMRFYRDVLGFSVVDAAPPGDEPDWVWMRWHGIDLMFNTAYEKEYRPTVPDQQRLAAHEDTSIYFGCKQIDELYAYLLSKGIQVAPPSITGYNFKALYVKDPDQFLLVFHWPVEPGSPVAQFEAAVDAIVQGDIDTLAGLLRENPELIRMRSQRSHQATLLHYVGANGVENYRQKTPPNAVAILQLLLDAGAEVDAIATMYGGSTTLGLVATSVHPAQAGLMFPLLETLLQAGASIEFPGAAGNGHKAVIGCLHNGRPEAADFLARHGAELDLEGACGVGRLDIVQSFFNEDGSLKPSATLAQLKDGFMWASGYGYIAVVEYLLQKGVDINMEVGGFCPIHYAIMGEHLDIIRLLIEHGASLEIENRYGGTALGCALWRIANPDYYIEHSPEQVAEVEVAIFETLLAAGAVVDPGMLPWLQEQKKVPAAIKVRIEQLFQRYRT